MADNPIFAINARVAEMRARGADIIMLTAGEPQAATGAAIIAAAQAAIADEHTHHYGPAAGDIALRRTVAASLPGTRSWDEQDVLITSGAKHALYLGVRALTRPSDEVLIVEPGWPGHAAAVRAAGALPVPVRTGHDLRITADIIRAQTTPRTRAVILASPANPTGSVIPAEELYAIAQWADEAGMWIVSDDVYSAFDYTGSYAHVLNVAPAAHDRVVVVDSVSKEHAMTGWRVGWLAAPQAVVEHAREHLAATITNVPLALQAAAAIALFDTRTPTRARTQYRRRRDRLVAALNAIPGVDCPPPDGGMFVFPSVQALLEGRSLHSASVVADRLLDEGVAVVPGEAFGAPDRLRICFAVDDDTLDAAIARLRTGLSSFLSERPSVS